MTELPFCFLKKGIPLMHKCETCGNIFKIEWIGEGPDYNDFGYRYCPFCGAMFDTFIIDKQD